MILWPYKLYFTAGKTTFTGNFFDKLAFLNDGR